MSSLRILVVIVAAALAGGITVHGQEETAWQPYPNGMSQTVIVSDAISDFDLDLLAQSRDDSFQPSYSMEPYFAGAPIANPQVRTFEMLPDGVIWHSYWAGAKEPRLAGTVFEETNTNVSLLDVSLGGRSSLFRYGNTVDGRLQGWELQIEGAGMLRLNLDENWDLEAVDFRFGVPIIYAQGDFQWKFSYYHLSSHLGDENIIRTGNLAQRINYSRDTLVAAVSYFPLPAWRWYAETGWAFYSDGGSDPWEFQFGLDYAQPGPTGRRGTPFAAINGHLRQEVDFGGNLVVQAGWLWRGNTGRVLRTGLHYYNGKSNQFEFFNNFEQQIGVGLWHDY